MSISRVVPGQVVILAGGSLGVGSIAARALSSAGVSVHFALRGPVPTLEPVPEGRGEVIFVDTEAFTPTEVCETVGDVSGRLDALVYCAAPALVFPYWQLDAAAWRRGVEEPLFDAHHWVQAAMLQMREQRHGRIIIIGPAAGLEPNDDRVATSTLAGAFRGLTESLAYAGLRLNVQCWVLRLGARPVDVGRPTEHAWAELESVLISLLEGTSGVPSGGVIDLVTQVP